MATELLVNISLGNGFLPEGTNPLPQLTLIYIELGTHLN